MSPAGARRPGLDGVSALKALAAPNSERALSVRRIVVTMPHSRSQATL
jgi:hypothetical protein